ncbi:transglutaminase-like domain-containing protein [Maritalea porphyrae]|uniref:Transglutaminase n=1 Tax=Maritalea porphyrae TaxID=880732 RepID=A0ABQ5UQT8_9HYPH|nr:transglutaminase-like domain-containing protein [Maritalea porphyrae]GLQ16297.1 transglutaminase [Maritalea porphyrae]
MANNDLLKSTRLLDFNHPTIQKLVQSKNWRNLSDYDKIGAAYDFVQNQIKFGYNRKDSIPASEVLKDGYGQCNTKGTLLMALLRALNIPCRLHGFTIKKSLQRGVVPELVYAIAPENILHSWVEVQFEDQWVYLEGFILDRAFLGQLQKEFSDQSSLCAYGVGTDCLQTPNIDWTGQNTYIQRTGINQDFGLFDTPDEFYAEHQQEFSPLKDFLYQHIIRHWMNARVANARRGNIPIIPTKKGAQ